MSLDTWEDGTPDDWQDETPIHKDWGRIRKLRRVSIDNLVSWSLGFSMEVVNRLSDDHPVIDDYSCRKALCDRENYPEGRLPSTGTLFGEETVSVEAFIKLANAEGWEPKHWGDIDAKERCRLRKNVNKAPSRLKIESLRMASYTLDKYLLALEDNARLKIEAYVEDNLKAINAWAQKKAITMQYTQGKQLAANVRALYKAKTQA
jgi:hypothetical protein